jgi:hypothetical protein
MSLTQKKCWVLVKRALSKKQPFLWHCLPCDTFSVDKCVGAKHFSKKEKISIGEIKVKCSCGKDCEHAKIVREDFTTLTKQAGVLPEL